MTSQETKIKAFTSINHHQINKKIMTFEKKNKNKGIHLLHKSKKVQYYAKNGHHIIESAAVFQVL